MRPDLGAVRETLCLGDGPRFQLVGRPLFGGRFRCLARELQGPYTQDRLALRSRHIPPRNDDVISLSLSSREGRALGWGA